MAQLVIQRAVEKPNQFGFRVNMIAGSGVPEVTAAYGMFRNMDTGVAHHFDVPEMYVSYIAPLGKGLRFDAGKMASHLGSEIIGGYDGYNDEFSRGFIFGFGVPFTYTGVKATYAFTQQDHRHGGAGEWMGRVSTLQQRLFLGQPDHGDSNQDHNPLLQLHSWPGAPARRSRPAQRGRNCGKLEDDAAAESWL